MWLPFQSHCHVFGWDKRSSVLWWDAIVICGSHVHVILFYIFFPRNQRLSDAGKSVGIMTTSVKKNNNIKVL